MATSVLSPVKTEDQILQDSMLEDDPNDNSATNEEEKTKPRWGPYHKGAKELASLYSKGESESYHSVYLDEDPECELPVLFCVTLCYSVLSSISAWILSFLVSFDQENACQVLHCLPPWILQCEVCVWLFLCCVDSV